jgi:TonB family protein
MRRRMEYVLVALQALTVGVLLALPFANVRAQAKKPAPTKPVTSFNAVILTPLEGVDFNVFVDHLMLVVTRNWYLEIPESAMLGDKGKVVLRLQIQKDGKLLGHTPTIEISSGKKSLDRAALDAVRASAPFKHLPEAFRSPNIDLRLTFLYNLPPGPT